MQTEKKIALLCVVSHYPSEKIVDNLVMELMKPMKCFQLWYFALLLSKPVSLGWIVRLQQLTEVWLLEIFSRRLENTRAGFRFYSKLIKIVHKSNYYHARESLW